MAKKSLHRRVRDFAIYRSRPLRGSIKHTALRPILAGGPKDCRRVHVGCGVERLEGWINVDLLELPEVDVAMDVTRGFPFDGLTHVFAEHFLEHLAIDDAVRFLGAAHRSLEEGGHLRLSTPNLDWVWAHVYAEGASEASDRRRIASLQANRAFYAWGHRYLWNREMLATLLESSGFEDLRWHAYGESETPEFQGLERHETYPDDPELPHVLIAEARKGARDRAAVQEFCELIQREFLSHLDA